MYRRKSVGSRLEIWGIPAFIGYSMEKFQSQATQSHLLLRKDKTRKILDLQSTRFEFVRLTSRQNSVESSIYHVLHFAG